MWEWPWHLRLAYEGFIFVTYFFVIKNLLDAYLFMYVQLFFSNHHGTYMCVYKNVYVKIKPWFYRLSSFDIYFILTETIIIVIQTKCKWGFNKSIQFRVSFCNLSNIIFYPLQTIYYQIRSTSIKCLKHLWSSTQYCCTALHVL